MFSTGRCQSSRGKPLGHHVVHLQARVQCDLPGHPGCRLPRCPAHAGTVVWLHLCSHDSRAGLCAHARTPAHRASRRPVSRGFRGSVAERECQSISHRGQPGDEGHGTNEDTRLLIVALLSISFPVQRHFIPHLPFVLDLFRSHSVGQFVNWQDCREARSLYLKLLWCKRPSLDLFIHSFVPVAESIPATIEHCNIMMVGGLPSRKRGRYRSSRLARLQSPSGMVGADSTGGTPRLPVAEYLVESRSMIDNEVPQSSVFTFSGLCGGHCGGVSYVRGQPDLSVLIAIPSRGRLQNRRLEVSALRGALAGC